jgi:hypothetical protein
VTKLKNSLIAFTGLMLLAGIIAVLLQGVGHGQQTSGGNSPVRGLRRYYLTVTLHKGNEALTACADGYHMASLWEIHDPSNLRYDTALGFKRGDSGSSPPSGTVGWVRTGWDANESDLPGSSNCNAWTSDSPFGEGTAVELPRLWRLTDGPVISPWISLGELCFEPLRVWCVQD